MDVITRRGACLRSVVTFRALTPCVARAYCDKLLKNRFTQFSLFISERSILAHAPREASGKAGETVALTFFAAGFAANFTAFFAGAFLAGTFLAGVFWALVFAFGLLGFVVMG